MDRRGEPEGDDLCYLDYLKMAAHSDSISTNKSFGRKQLKWFVLFQPLHSAVSVNSDIARDRLRTISLHRQFINRPTLIIEGYMRNATLLVPRSAKPGLILQFEQDHSTRQRRNVSNGAVELVIGIEYALQISLTISEDEKLTEYTRKTGRTAKRQALQVALKSTLIRLLPKIIWLRS